MPSTDRVALQICHSTAAPFTDLCAVYSQALEQLGWRCRTIFLKKDDDGSHRQFETLDLESSSLHGLKLNAGRSLRARLHGQLPRLLLCHRYKSLYTAALSGLVRESRMTLAFAHEMNYFKRWGRRFFQRVYADNVHFVGVSPPVCDDLSRAHRRIANQVHCVPNGIDLAQFDDGLKTRAQARAELGIAEHDRVVVQLGRLHPMKQPQATVEALALLNHEHPDVQLVFAGSGSLLDELNQQARTLGVLSKVRFLGFIPEFRALLPAFDALILPSRHDEVFGVVILEAMAAGVPVVTSDTPGPAYVVKGHGETCAYGDPVALAGALQTVLTMPDDQRAARIASAREYVAQTFSVDATARALARVIEPHLSP